MLDCVNGIFKDMLRCGLGVEVDLFTVDYTYDVDSGKNIPTYKHFTRAKALVSNLTSAERANTVKIDLKLTILKSDAPTITTENVLSYNNDYFNIVSVEETSVCWILLCSKRD